MKCITLDEISGIKRKIKEIGDPTKNRTGKFVI